MPSTKKTTSTPAAESGLTLVVGGKTVAASNKTVDEQGAAYRPAKASAKRAAVENAISPAVAQAVIDDANDASPDELAAAEAIIDRAIAGEGDTLTAAKAAAQERVEAAKKLREENAAKRAELAAQEKAAAEAAKPVKRTVVDTGYPPADAPVTKSPLWRVASGVAGVVKEAAAKEFAAAKTPTPAAKTPATPKAKTEHSGKRHIRVITLKSGKVAVEVWVRSGRTVRAEFSDAKTATGAANDFATKYAAKYGSEFPIVASKEA